ncbi:hypothetical protein Pse7367_3019 [Thalassoporum mexicanum PCC 7367]|uniref:PFE-CTERM domain-containing protein n=1 Tax=Thalassoporum mexicanum TaxID=3457544 RepID=UPI00029FC8A4|nr:hypothetical protein [Pseudanabaena sp. PCC 7367]AFY71269.1 hypothetical protein Pse7367_3019 [Pseudanabaena sp. PCC 7367]
MLRFSTATAVITLAIGGFNPSAAEALTWTINNAAYDAVDGGGTISGTFDYVASAGPDGTYSNINITSTAGSVAPFQNGNSYPGASITYTGFQSGDENILTTSPVSGFFLQLTFGGSGLTDAGGTVNISAGIIELSSPPIFGFRRIDDSLNPTVTAVPFEFESGLGLIALGSIFGISAYRQKQKAKAAKTIIHQ